MIISKHTYGTQISILLLVVDCGDPGPIDVASIEMLKTTYNSVVTYTCNNGFDDGNGNAEISITCGADGIWKSRKLCQGM